MFDVLYDLYEQFFTDGNGNFEKQPEPPKEKVHEKLFDDPSEIFVMPDSGHFIDTSNL